MNLKIVSYNCGGIRSNPNLISDLLAKADIIFLQETMLSEFTDNFLYRFDDNYSFISKNGIRNDDAFRGRSSGGLAIFWRNSLNHCIREFCTPSNRINGIIIEGRNGKKFLILNCYLPCDYGTYESLLQYEACLSDIELILNEDSEDFEEISLVGDFNCDVSKGRFFAYFQRVVNNYDMSIVDIERLSPDSFTYISRRNCCSTSWLDHVISSNQGSISNVEVLYGLSVEDHIPVYFSYSVPDIVQNEIATNDESPPFVLWNKLTELDKECYSTKLDFFLDKYMNEAFSCSSQNCTCEDHRRLIDESYQYLCKSIFLASEDLQRKNNTKFQVVVGWNDLCKDFHKEARVCFLKWKNEGRIRMGETFEKMKTSRMNLKKALNFCKHNEMKLKKKKLIESFKEKSKNMFWKEVRKLTCKSRIVNSIIDGRSTSEEILNVFKNKYQRVLDNKECQGKSDAFDQIMDDFRHKRHVNKCMVFRERVVEAVQLLNDGIGHDFLHSNFMKYAGSEFISYVSKMFSAFLSHSYVPEEMLYGEIRPIIKNEKGSKNESANYRPVMNSSNFLKLFEYCLLPTLKKHLKLSSAQFGYRPKTSCLTANLVLRETILSYTKRNSNIHSAVLDMSNAFDRLNNNILIEKLITQTGLPSPIIKLIQFMSENQFVWIGFGGRRGNKWQVKNGTRQGGILSGLLFNFYVNDVLKTIRELQVGCSLQHIRMNILGYADDLILLCPSANGLQFLIDKLFIMLSHLCLKLNVEKSVYIVFRRKRSLKTEFNQVIFLEDRTLKLVREIKYLGVVLSDNLCINKDIVRCCTSFKKQFHSMIAKFNFMDVNILSFLFTSYCSSMYGAELWSDRMGAGVDFDHFGVIYHRAVKKIAGLNTWDSNHQGCRITSLPIFKHYMLTKKF